MLFEQLPGSLYIGDILKRVFGDQKEAPGVKVQVKKIGGFLEGAEVVPIPPLAAFFSLQEDALIFQGEGKSILESSRSFIDTKGQQPSDRQP